MDILDILNSALVDQSQSDEVSFTPLEMIDMIEEVQSIVRITGVVNTKYLFPVLGQCDISGISRANPNISFSRRDVLGCIAEVKQIRAAYEQRFIADEVLSAAQSGDLFKLADRLQHVELSEADLASLRARCLTRDSQPEGFQF